MRLLSLTIAAALALITLTSCADNSLDDATVSFEPVIESQLVGEKILIEGRVKTQEELDYPLTLIAYSSIGEKEPVELSTLELPVGVTSFSFEDSLDAPGAITFKVSVFKKGAEEPALEGEISFRALELAAFVAENLEISLRALPVRQKPSGDSTELYVAGDVIKVQSSIAWKPGTELPADYSITMHDDETTTELASPQPGTQSIQIKLKTESSTAVNSNLVLSAIVSHHGSEVELDSEQQLTYLNLTTATNDFISQLEKLVRIDMLEALNLIEEYGAPVFLDTETSAWMRTIEKWQGRTWNAGWGVATDKINYFSYDTTGFCAPQGVAKVHNDETTRPFGITVIGRNGEYGLEGAYKDGKVFLNVVPAVCTSEG